MCNMGLFLNPGMALGEKKFLRRKENNKELQKLKEKILELGKKHVDGSQSKTG